MTSTLNELRAQFEQNKKRRLIEGTKNDWKNKKYTEKANEFSGKFAKEQIIDGAVESVICFFNKCTSYFTQLMNMLR